ncbi:hypothetical protein QFC21_005489 [Naganishia friedmannii]|uniref:Uncharacterized protein n=1 Tax=Naganishia friedmannii TaxID=89922 RepID=A0ACC2V8C8_9TREE|nr:hypothetical protein QFC21_005489 [Naganishia friedmannii]
MLRGKKDPLSGQQIRPIETRQPERPLYKVYRPSGAAHSKGILINPDTKSALAIPHINNRKYRKEHKHANDQAALDRLLAPQFQSGAIAEERKSFDYQGGIGLGLAHSGGDGIAGPSRGVDRLTSRSGSVKTHTSDGTGHGHGDANGGGKRRLLSGRHRSSRNDGRDGDGRSDGNDAEERLTSKTLGVYIDKQGRLHDKEYDPFETVRSLSQKKFERRSAFGAAREDDSEAGSDISGSFVGRDIGARNAGMLETYGRTTSQGQMIAGNPAFNARDRQRVQELQNQVRIEDDDEESGDIADGHYAFRPPANGIAGKSWNNDDDRDYRFHSQEQEDSNEDATNRTVYSEYDSGVSATSPKGEDGGKHPSFARISTTQRLPHFQVGRLQIDSQRNVPSTAGSSSASRSSPHLSNTSKQGPSTSMKTQASRLAQLEERPRSLLYPATPAQIAAQQEKAKGKRGMHGVAGADPDVFIPPVAPFNPAYHTSRPTGSRAPSLSSVERAISGRRGSYHSHNKGNASTVFASHEMSYLPTRWARGDHEIRVGEESIEKYRPLEWQGSQKAGVSGNGEPDWT